MGDDLADMQLKSKCNKEITYLLCVIDLYSKYAWLFPLKDRKNVATVNVLQSIWDNLKRKPSKVWVDQDSEFYNNSFKKKRQWIRNIFNK